MSLYRQLIGLRNAHPALRSSGYFPVSSRSSGVYAALRATKDEAILVLLNLGSRAIDQYDLKIDASLLRGRYTWQPLLGGGDAFAELVVDDKGGFGAYRPLPELAPGASYVLLLKQMQ